MCTFIEVAINSFCKWSWLGIVSTVLRAAVFKDTLLTDFNDVAIAECETPRYSSKSEFIAFYVQNQLQLLCE